MGKGQVSWTIFRPATRVDSRKVAELFVIAPGLTLLEVGARRHAGEEGNFSDKNSTVAELGGEVIGMLHAFPIEGGPVAPGEERHGRLLYGNL